MGALRSLRPNARTSLSYIEVESVHTTLSLKVLHLHVTRTRVRADIQRSSFESMTSSKDLAMSRNEFERIYVRR